VVADMDDDNAAADNTVLVVDSSAVVPVAHNMVVDYR